MRNLNLEIFDVLNLSRQQRAMPEGEAVQGEAAQLQSIGCR